MDKTCFLIGFMGSGKTYWGTRLARHLAVPFVDLDGQIETGEQQTIEAIFEQQGEAGFRQMERRYLNQLENTPPCVVATGGGTPCFFDNMDWMNAHGTTVFLNTPVPVLASRLRTDQTVRPLLSFVPENQLEARIEQLLELRKPYYHKANVVAEYSDTLDLNRLLQLIFGGIG